MAGPGCDRLRDSRTDLRICTYPPRRLTCIPPKAEDKSQHHLHPFKSRASRFRFITQTANAGGAYTEKYNWIRACWLEGRMGDAYKSRRAPLNCLNKSTGYPVCPSVPGSCSSSPGFHPSSGAIYSKSAPGPFPFYCSGYTTLPCLALPCLAANASNCLP